MSSFFLTPITDTHSLFLYTWYWSGWEGVGVKKRVLRFSYFLLAFPSVGRLHLGIRGVGGKRTAKVLVAYRLGESEKVYVSEEEGRY